MSEDYKVIFMGGKEVKAKSPSFKADWVLDAVEMTREGFLELIKRYEKHAVRRIEFSTKHTHDLEKVFNFNAYALGQGNEADYDTTIMGIPVTFHCRQTMIELMETYTTTDRKISMEL